MNREINQLKLLIKTDYLTDIKSKSFWIGTFLAPVLIIAFGAVIGFLASDSDAMQEVASATGGNKDLTGPQVAGMLVGMILTMFLMMFGAQVYSKVRKEKVNRIMEVLATCVTGRQMMLAKVISVALVGLTQLFFWMVLILAGAIVIMVLTQPDIPWEYLRDPRLYLGTMWCILFLVGGYVFYAALYAACGAMTDKDSENQGYMSALTFMLLGSMYVSMYATDHVNTFTMICSFIPFTAPSICVTNALAGSVPVWVTILECIALYAFAWLAISFSGKIYTSSILMKGKKFSPKDILLFMRMK